MEIVKTENLEFGKNIFKNDYVPSGPHCDSMTKIVDEDDLDRFKKAYPNLEIVIDRNEYWFSRIRIPAWKKDREAHKKRKMNTLKLWKTTE